MPHGLSSPPFCSLAPSDTLMNQCMFVRTPYHTGEAVIRDDHETNKISVSAKCEKGESSLLCSASGDETIAGSLDLIPLMTKQHGVNHPNVDKFDKAHADVLSVGLTVVN
mmetsp:Transcript_28800/g.46227  ORF Transcript_28800/g.46227 Transcript_28800/m.46227 type:complete len:110 (-) Transcript_28800:264-593(-)